MKFVNVKSLATTALIAGLLVGVPAEVCAVPPTGDYAALSTAVTAEWDAAKGVLIPLAGAMVAILLCWKYGKRFLGAS